MSTINYKDKALDLFLIIGGILIALWINNWNEDRSDQKLEKTYLQSMAIDLEIEIEAYKSVLQGDSLTREYVNYILHSFSKPIEEIDQAVLIKNLGNTVMVNNLSTLNTTYEDMKSSGNLKLIRSESLRQQILKYYNYTDEIARVENTNNGFWIKNGGEFVLRYGDQNAALSEIPLPHELPYVDPPQFRLWQLPKDHHLVKEFINNMSFRHVTNQLIENRHSGGLERAVQLKSAIDQYLD